MLVYLTAIRHQADTVRCILINFVGHTPNGPTT